MSIFGSSTRKAVERAKNSYYVLKSGNFGHISKPVAQQMGSQALKFCDVTLRDGQQQQIDKVTQEQRVEVFDAIVRTGVDRVEIGHLGNPVDQDFAHRLVGHIAEQEKTDELYKNVQLQVLFGSQPELIEAGSQVLVGAFQEFYPDNWQEEMQKRVVVHVYDRIDGSLRQASSEAYTMEQSAARVVEAAMLARDKGIVNFSISGEAATTASPEEAIQFYRYITAWLVNTGADSVNVNLANTYGFSPNEVWNAGTLTIFNEAIKHGLDDKVTTSIHAHNDVNSANDFTWSAIVAGFDRVESTHIGMGERVGNVASVDVVSRILELARQQKITPEMKKSAISRLAGRFMTQHTVKLDEQIVINLVKWYESGEILANIYGQHARDRWHKTSLGNPSAHDNGSGPHDQMMAKAIEDPLNYPPYMNYEWLLAINSIMGRPGTGELAVGDPAWVDKVTVGNDAGGGKTQLIKSGQIVRANPEIVQQAEINFDDFKRKITGRLLEGVVIRV